MQTYHIMRVDNQFSDWTEIPRARISCFKWMDNGYEPEAWGQMVFMDQVGFLVRMNCREDGPRATFINENDPVCKDSCLEFFGDFDPDGKGGYLNCEANAYGTLLCGYGAERKGRKKLMELNLLRPEIKPFREDGLWGYELLIPVSLLDDLYGRKEWVPGSVIRGNFYKCGDETPLPHFGMWNPIDCDHPDFHRPEQFGELIVD